MTLLLCRESPKDFDLLQAPIIGIGDRACKSIRRNALESAQKRYQLTTVSICSVMTFDN